MARAVADFFRHPRQVVGRAGSRDGEGRLEPGQVPRLRRRHQGQAALGSRHTQVRHERRGADDQRCVDLVGDDPYTVALGEGGHGGQLVGGVDGAGGVVRAAQQVGGPPPAGGHPAEGVLQDGEVEPSVPAQRGLGHPAVHVPDEVVEGRVHRRVHHDRIAVAGDQLEHLDHAQHDVGHERGAPHGEPVPGPPLLREGGQRLGVAGSGRVAGVAEFHGLGDGAHDRFGQGYVHLGHPQGQHVLGMGAPLHAGAQAQTVEGESVQGIRFTGRFVRDPGHGHTIGAVV